MAWVHLSALAGRETTKWRDGWCLPHSTHSQIYREHSHKVSGTHLHFRVGLFFSPILCICVCIVMSMWHTHTCAGQKVPNVLLNYTPLSVCSYLSLSLYSPGHPRTPRMILSSVVCLPQPASWVLDQRHGSPAPPASILFFKKMLSICIHFFLQMT